MLPILTALYENPRASTLACAVIASVQVVIDDLPQRIALRRLMLEVVSL
jgi:hypothetical protein